jgi:glycosyltransferase involved in cell wall biosynthesis
LDLSLPPRVRVAFVLTELTVGGAEMMLWKLASRVDRQRFELHVIALSGRSDRMLDLFHEIDVPCRFLGVEPNFSGLRAIPLLTRALREIGPDVIQGWLYHANVAASLATLFWRDSPPVVWNVRGTLQESENRLSRAVMRLGGLLAFMPKRIINNSVTSALEHEQRLGYPARKRVVLPNGFDTDVFVPDAAARTSLRQSLGVEPSAVLVGLFARYHPVKDHATFLAAAARVAALRSEVHFVLVGENVDSTNAALKTLLREHDLPARVHLLGPRHDVPHLMAALDALVCSSTAEGFPNVVGEAMSCGIPCIVTDVGDCARIVAETGRIVAPGHPRALADAMLSLIALDEDARRQLGADARERVVRLFSLDVVARQYEQLYVEVCEHCARSRAR